MKMTTIIKLVEQVENMNKLEWDDIEVDGNQITICGIDYIVLDENEIKERMDEHLQETASYFNHDFLSSMTELPEEVFEGLTDKNKTVYNLIEKTCGIEEFIDECLRVDGAGNFLNSYNGNEYELEDGLSAFNC
jgi:hypothetical protein